MKRIVVDARFYGVKDTGIGRYVQELIAHLPSQVDIKIILIVSPKHQYAPELASYEKHIAYHHPYTVSSLFEMFFILLRIRPDLVHIPHLTIPIFWPGKIIVTIHDLIKHESRGVAASTHTSPVYWLKYLQYLCMSTFAVYRSDHIIVPAKFWKDRLIKKFNISPTKISVTYEGVTLDKTEAVHLDLPDKPYVIYVGNVYPHKNIPILLQAIQELKGDVLLFLVCARSTFTDRIQTLISDLGLQAWVKYLGSVSDSDLYALYKNSLAYVFPSKIEGFGLPGLEAMAAGTPVIAANASCLPEIYDQSALYFDPDDASDLANKILILKNDTKLRSNFILKGKSQVKKYSWSKMGKETLAIYLKYL